MKSERTNKEEMLERVCAETWKEIYRFIYYRVLNREEAEDITQETFLKTLAYLKKNEVEIIDYRNYLKTIAINIIRDRWRSSRRKGTSIPIEDTDSIEMSVEDFTDRLNEKALVEEAMAKLTKEQRTVINLRIMEGYSSKETAKLMKKKEGTIRVLQYRAVKALSEILGNQQGRSTYGIK